MHHSYHTTLFPVSCPYLSPLVNTTEAISLRPLHRPRCLKLIPVNGFRNHTIGLRRDECKTRRNPEHVQSLKSLFFIFISDMRLKLYQDVRFLKVKTITVGLVVYG